MARKLTTAVVIDVLKFDNRVKTYIIIILVYTLYSMFYDYKLNNNKYAIVIIILRFYLYKTIITRTLSRRLVIIIIILCVM